MIFGVFQWITVGDLLISYGTSGRIPDDVFEAWIEALRARQTKRYLTIVDGTLEMTSIQRKIASEAGRRLRVAAVTDDRIVRGIATAISWLGVDIKAFPHTELSLAIKHLGAQDMEDQLIPKIKQLKETCRKMQTSAKRPLPPK